MPCCNALVTLRRSKRGTQFFAHKAKDGCATAPESEAHLRLKQIAVEVARAHGWEAETEIADRCPTGEGWTADVLARRGTARVAIEIQWSSQTVEETARRQARYAASGVRGLWLMRRFAAPISDSVPATRVSQNESGGFLAHLSTPTSEQTMSVEEFLAAAFSGRLKFGLPLGASTKVSVQAGSAPCWSCGALTRIITDLTVTLGPHEYSFSVSDMDDAFALFDPIYQSLPTDLGIGAVKRRYSRTLGRSYLSNGCVHCDALFGQFHESEAFNDRETILVTALPLDEGWQEMLATEEEVVGWGVFDFASE